MVTATMEAPTKTTKQQTELPARIVEVQPTTQEVYDAEHFLVEREAFIREEGAQAERMYKLPEPPEMNPLDKPVVRIEKRQKYEADLRDVPVNVPVKKSHRKSARHEPGFYVVTHPHVWRLNFSVCAPNGEDTHGTVWSEQFTLLSEAKASAPHARSPYPVSSETKHKGT